ncbi:MAG: FHA domain-containing protein [Deltaproteobacteria bacterium]|nr:FHA domain-containing protein [Deltaproteobacteria bacterium]
MPRRPGFMMARDKDGDWGVMSFPYHVVTVGSDFFLNDVALPYPQVSRQHVVVHLLPGICRIQNVSSANGVLVAGVWIEPGAELYVQLDTHIFNALIEAAALAPALAEEFGDIKVRDAFLALLYHDVGKKDGARDPSHMQRSLELARYHLKLMDLSGEQRVRRERILRLIKAGGIYSDIVLNGSETAVQQLKGELADLLVELFLVNFSDTASIPGRSGRIMQHMEDYSDIVDARPALIRAFRGVV